VAQKLLTVLSAICAPELVLRDIAAHEPVTDREAEDDGASSLGGELRVDAANGKDEIVEG
jgi:hypothetical protein